MEMNLFEIGWNNDFQAQFAMYNERGLIPGRVIRHTRHLYTVVTEKSETTAEISGHFQYTAVSPSDFPTVGDWVALRYEDSLSIIEAVLQRQTLFSRKAAGDETKEQVIAANINTLCVVAGLDGGRNFNLRGIERYLALANSGGAKSIIILNKSDQCKDIQAAKRDAESVSGKTPVFYCKRVDWIWN
jgi:ribosome biogenesis GTPase